MLMIPAKYTTLPLFLLPFIVAIGLFAAAVAAPLSVWLSRLPQLL